MSFRSIKIQMNGQDNYVNLKNLSISYGLVPSSCYEKLKRSSYFVVSCCDLEHEQLAVIF